MRQMMWPSVWGWKWLDEMVVVLAIWTETGLVEAILRGFGDQQDMQTQSQAKTGWL